MGTSVDNWYVSGEWVICYLLFVILFGEWVRQRLMGMSAVNVMGMSAVNGYVTG